MNSNVMKIARINLRGNTMDRGWFKHLILENGKPYMVAITVLSEIFYWYKPTEIQDEKTNTIRYKQKFKADKLQKSYQQLADSFGFTKRQVLEACKYLLKRELITIEFRTIIVNGTRLNNVMYVEPVVDNIEKISILYQAPITPESDTLSHYKEGGSHITKGEAPTLKRGTNTKITTEITNNNICAAKADTKKKSAKHSYSDDFEEIWSIYPKKRNKPKAYQRYKEALEKSHSHDDIKHGITCYAKECERNSTELTFIKMMEGFLNDERYFEYKKPEQKQQPVNYSIDNLLD
ncbi:DNA replication protein DnaD [Bacillus toyonensis]|uniref:DNA replication protein DnaD n=1 Tax=Bacillus toyonensis TaxID=155322 RepID=UPI00211D737A|nr:DNA replication protein DnaD [Bacillus toyonensis]